MTHVWQPDPSLYLSDNYVVVDFETDTSHGDYGHAVHPDNGLLLASVKLHNKGAVSYWGDEFSQETLLKVIEDADVLVCHNAKYELGWLRRCGYDVASTLVFDTKIAEYVLLGNLAAGCKATGLPPRSTSLDVCVQRRGWKQKDPAVDILMHHGINPIEIPRKWLQGRCEQDVTDTERLFWHQREHLAATNRLGVMYTRCLFTPVLADIEFQGMKLDADRVEEYYQDAKKEFAILEDRMNRMTGGINWRSGLQVAEFLYDTLKFEELKDRQGIPRRTSSGRRKADKATLAALKGTTKEQKDFIKLRGELGKVGAALSKSLEFFQGICKEQGEVFYAVFNQTTTATHRLSSSGIRTFFKMFDEWKQVQFQNMARIYKSLFIAKKPDSVMMEVDGAQLEFRIAAQLGNDAQAIADILDPDFDAHVQSASIMNDIPYDEFLREYRAGSKRHKTMRTAAKVDTFKPLYGGESGTKKQKKWYKAFKERYSGIADAQAGWVFQVLADKELTTEWGMKYYWPRAAVGRDGYVNVKSSVYNYPVQALATAEIIPLAVTFLWQRLKDAGLQSKASIVNTVHDSAILEVDRDYVEQVQEIAMAAFTTDVYKYMKDIYNIDFIVPLGCGINVAEHWSEGEEKAFNVWPDGRMEEAA